MNEENKNKKDFKKLFNMNNVLSQIVSWSAYIILVGSVILLLYVSFVSKFDIVIDWTTLGIFTAAAVLLAWLNWNTFYRKRYEKILADDIAQSESGKYSIHARFYYAIKDWTNATLQKKIDIFNKEYEEAWLTWVENYTGYTIKGYWTQDTDEYGNKLVNDDGTPKMMYVKGILDLPYKGFKHKLIMWRIKTHHYPQSGYKSAIEVMSLLSFQETNASKRQLKAEKKFYARKSSTKFLTLLLTVSVTGSLIPEFIAGNRWAALLKLLIALCSLGSAVIMGAINGIRGGRIKLSIVQDVCVDLESWGNKKPVVEPFSQPTNSSNIEVTQLEMDLSVLNTENTQEVTYDIFNKPKITK